MAVADQCFPDIQCPQFAAAGSCAVVARLEVPKFWTAPGEGTSVALTGRDAAPMDLFQGGSMANHTYSISEVVGTSPDGVDAAVRNAISQASKTLRNLDWFEVREIRGHLENGAVADWQVTVKLGFRLEE